jgi:hypothetical protein
MDFSKNKSEDLAAQVVLYRSLKINKELSTKCMIELAKRREAGDQFDFESFIEQELNKLPKPQNKSGNISNILKLLENFKSGN